MFNRQPASVIFPYALTRHVSENENVFTLLARHFLCEWATVLRVYERV